MRNKLWCKFNCQARQELQYQIALAYNKSVGDEKYEHGYLVLSAEMEGGDGSEK